MPQITATDVMEKAGVPHENIADVMPRVDPNNVSVRLAPAPMLSVWPKGIVAMTMPWAVYVHPDIWERFTTGGDPERDGRLIVHELMHVEQVRRHGAIRHGATYLFDYLRGRVRGFDHWEAYRAVGFEQEARAASQLVLGRQ